VPLAVPMALGLALGVVMAQSGGPPTTRITATAANTDCELIVPPNPLTARTRPGRARPAARAHPQLAELTDPVDPVDPLEPGEPAEPVGEPVG
jgi:hypothetical protein